MIFNFTGYFSTLNENIYLLDTYSKDALSPKNAIKRLENKNITREAKFLVMIPLINQ